MGGGYYLACYNRNRKVGGEDFKGDLDAARKRAVSLLSKCDRIYIEDLWTGRAVGAVSAIFHPDDRIASYVIRTNGKLGENMERSVGEY